MLQRYKRYGDTPEEELKAYRDRLQRIAQGREIGHRQGVSAAQGQGSVSSDQRSTTGGGGQPVHTPEGTRLPGKPNLNVADARAAVAANVARDTYAQALSGAGSAKTSPGDSQVAAAVTQKAGELAGSRRQQMLLRLLQQRKQGAMGRRRNL